MRNTCVLCGARLHRIQNSTGYQAHPDTPLCAVRVTDAWGIAVDDDTDTDDPIRITAATDDEPGDIKINLFPPVEEACHTVFARYKLPRLGGASSGKGWSGYATWQRCPYAWKRRYIDVADETPFLGIEPPGRAIGTLVHTFLALYYSRMIKGSPYAALTPKMMNDQLMLIANPEYVAEGWRLFTHYALYYQNEEIVPLAIEYDLKDPRTGESCRYDLVAFFPESHGERQAGVFNIDHKTAQRFDAPTLHGWANDGEILGQMALWKRLDADRRFGTIKGAIVNIIGKQKEPQFHRTIVAPESWHIDQHMADLSLWEGQIQTARATGIYPRARGNCINRFGFCDHWSHCTGQDG